MATNEANKQENMSIQNRVTCEYGGEKKKNQRCVSLFCSLSVYFVKQRTQLNESTHYKTENKTATTNHLHITHSPFSFISTFSYYTIPYYTDTREFVAVSLFFRVYLLFFIRHRIHNFATITIRFVCVYLANNRMEWFEVPCVGSKLTANGNHNLQLFFLSHVISRQLSFVFIFSGFYRFGANHTNHLRLTRGILSVFFALCMGFLSTL